MAARALARSLHPSAVPPPRARTAPRQLVPLLPGTRVRRVGAARLELCAPHPMPRVALRAGSRAAADGWARALRACAAARADGGAGASPEAEARGAMHGAPCALPDLAELRARALADGLPPDEDDGWAREAEADDAPEQDGRRSGGDGGRSDDDGGGGRPGAWLRRVCALAGLDVEGARVTDEALRTGDGAARLFAGPHALLWA